MAKKKKRTKKQRAQATERQARAASRKSKQDADPLKSMAIGGVIILLVLAFFTFELGEKTAFNHVLDLFGGDEEQTETDTGSSAAPAKAAPAQPKISASARRAAPMEKVSAKEQAALDDLIDRKSK